MGRHLGVGWVVAKRREEQVGQTHGAGGPLQIWADSEENGYYALAPDTIGTVLTTEVDGDRVVVVSTIDGRATSADRAALEDVIASLNVVG